MAAVRDLEDWIRGTVRVSSASEAEHVRRTIRALQSSGALSPTALSAAVEGFIGRALDVVSPYSDWSQIADTLIRTAQHVDPKLVAEGSAIQHHHALLRERAYQEMLVEPWGSIADGKVDWLGELQKKDVLSAAETSAVIRFWMMMKYDGTCHIGDREAWLSRLSRSFPNLESSVQVERRFIGEHDAGELLGRSRLARDPGWPSFVGALFAKLAIAAQPSEAQRLLRYRSQELYADLAQLPREKVGIFIAEAQRIVGSIS
jgi:hypothetical protein